VALYHQSALLCLPATAAASPRNEQQAAARTHITWISQRFCRCTCINILLLLLLLLPLAAYWLLCALYTVSRKTSKIIRTSSNFRQKDGQNDEIMLGALTSHLT